MSTTPVRFSSENNFPCAFSPVVSESPVKRGNLTGRPRVVRDFAADLYNIVQKWNDEHILGAKILNAIVFLKTSTISNPNIPHIDEDNLYPEGLQLLCDQLEKVYTVLSELNENVGSITHKMDGLVQYEEIYATNSPPLFQSWHTRKFGEVFHAIMMAYKQELMVKQCVKEEIAHCSLEETVMLHATAWTHQPYITSDVDLLLESLLLETGHRT